MDIICDSNTCICAFSKENGDTELVEKVTNIKVICHSRDALLRVLVLRVKLHHLNGHISLKDRLSNRDLTRQFQTSVLDNLHVMETHSFLKKDVCSLIKSLQYLVGLVFEGHYAPFKVEKERHYDMHNN
jgi:hypothetical protein